jgi:hypothetical protein
MTRRLVWPLFLPLVGCTAPVGANLVAQNSPEPPVIISLPAVVVIETEPPSRFLQSPPASLIYAIVSRRHVSGPTATKVRPLKPATVAPAKLGSPIDY